MIITNGRVLIDGDICEVDIRAEDGIIQKIENHITAKVGEEIIDADGRYVLPGFIDIHTHLDDTIGKYRIADDFESGSKIAVLNGITTLYTFITERTDRPLREAVEGFRSRGKQSLVNYGFHITPVNFSEKNSDYIKHLVESGFNSFKFYTTYKDAGIYMSYDEIESVVEKFKTEKTVFLIHCEDEGVLSKFKQEAYTTPADHSLSRPPEAEIRAVKNVIEIASRTDSKFHIVHCSCFESVRQINEAKNKLKMTVETCPQYLIFDKDIFNMPEGHRFFCTPPFRDEQERRLLLNATKNGAIDLFASDHCPFVKSDKDKHRDNLRMVPNGLPGIGALPHLVYDILINKGDKSLYEFSSLLSENPSRIMGIYPRKGVIKEGSDADIVMVSKSEIGREIVPTLSECFNPYEKIKSRITIDYVIINGVAVMRDGVIINIHNKGRCINDRE